jgi:hypothetical protein
MKSISERRDRWDAAVSRIQNYDAVIHHPYVLISPKMRRALLRDSAGPGAPVLEDAEADVYWRWVFSCAQELPAAYMKRVERFFPGKKVWITESGILGDLRPGKSGENMQTWANGLFSATYFISWMKYYPDVEVYLHHGLFMGKGVDAVLHDDLSYNANGIAFSLISKALEGASRMSVMNFERSAGYQGVATYKDVSIAALSGLLLEGNAGMRIVVTNTGNKAYSMALPFTDAVTHTYSAMPSDLVKAGEVKQIEDLAAGTATGGRVVVEPFSVMLITEGKSQ